MISSAPYCIAVLLMLIAPVSAQDHQVRKVQTVEIEGVVIPICSDPPVPLVACKPIPALLYEMVCEEGRTP